MGTSPAIRRSGFTIIEMMIVVVLLSIVAALFLPHLGPSIDQQLYSAAHVVASDLQYSRGLAVSNNSQYRLNFNIPLNRYELSHSGTSPVLDTLPPSAFFTSATGAGGKPVQYNSLALTPGSGGLVKLHDVTRNGLPDSPTIEFSEFGSLTTMAETTIWLTAGSGDQQRFVPILVNPSTGAVRVGGVSLNDAAGA